MVPNDISPDDPELAEIIRNLPMVTRRPGEAPYRPAAYTLPEVTRHGPARSTKVFGDIANGRLVAGYCGRRRFVLAIDFARWLLQMRRKAAGPQRLPGSTVSDVCALDGGHAAPGSAAIGTPVGRIPSDD